MSKPSDISLILVSAAGTGWDETGRLLGQASINATDLSLTALHETARDLAGSIGQSVDLVMCGTEDSSKASGSLLSEAVGCKLKSLDTLANLDLGLWEGALRDELEGRCPSSYKSWRDHPESIRPPEGESLAEALDRAFAGIRKATEKLKSKEPCVIVVCRSMLWAGLLTRLGMEPWGSYWSLAGETGQTRTLRCSFEDLMPKTASASA